MAVFLISPHPNVIPDILMIVNEDSSLKFSKVFGDITLILARKPTPYCKISLTIHQGKYMGVKL